MDPDAGGEANERLVRPHTRREAERLRADVRKLVYGRDRLPNGRPSFEPLRADEQARANLAPTVRRMVVDMPPTKAVAYLYEPLNPSRELIIYHSGHETVVPDAVLGDFLTRGHAVVTMYMPLHGPNAEYAPLIDLPRMGKVKAVLHGQLVFLERKGIQPLRFFVEPVSVILNGLLNDGRFDRVAMIGFSGGAWTTTLAAALDSRITRSYAVAGTLPLHLRWDDWTSWGDYEQTHPGLLATVDYLELYLLGALGEGRSHTQILNKHDRCCFAVPAVPAYVDTVRRRVEKIGPGRYEFFLDDTVHGHMLSPCALARIHEALEQNAH